MERVKQFKDLTISWECSVSSNLELHTDLPGGTLALQRTLVLGGTGSTRFNRTFPLDNPSLLEGRLLKLRTAPTGVLRLYEATLRYRYVGTYLDGAAGDIWDIQPVDFGSELLKQYREIELDADVRGAMTLELSTEVPSGALALRFTKALAASSGRVPINIRLTGDIRGKFLKCKLYGANTTILYGARVFAKTLGVASEWAWLPLPVVPTPEDWQVMRLPIVDTPEGWSVMKLPLAETPPEPIWADVPVDAIE